MAVGKFDEPGDELGATAVVLRAIVEVQNQRHVFCETSPTIPSMTTSDLDQPGVWRCLTWHCADCEQQERTGRD